MIFLQLDTLDKKPLYRQIVEQIEEAIRRGALQDGQALWSARKIAAHYHISYQTAERALAELARAGIVRRSVSSGTVVCHTRTDRPGRFAIQHKVIALLSCWEVWSLKPTYTIAELEITQAAAHTLSAAMWGLLSFMPGSGDVQGGFSVAKLADWCRQVKFDGAIVFGNMPERGLEWLTEQGYAVVVADAEPTGPYPRVVHDNYGGMRAAVEHLISQGHQRIAFLRGDRPYHYSIRQQAYEDALRAAGLPVDPERIFCVRRPRPTVEDAVSVWSGLPEDKRPTAIAAGSDIGAAQVLKRLQEHGLRVPEFVSLTGYDDEPFAPMLDPPLTTLHVSWAQIGQEAAHLLLDILNNKEPDDSGLGIPRRVVVPARLIVRSSTAPPLKPAE